MNSEKYAKEGELRFLIPVTWWRSWCEFVNFDIYQCLKEFKERPKGGIDHNEFADPP